MMQQKATRAMPAMQKTAHESDQPGWCSDPAKKLPIKVIAALDAMCGNDLYESDLIAGGHLDENNAKDDRVLIQYFEELPFPDDDELPFPYPGWGPGSRFWIVEDAQVYMAKYGYANYGQRLEAMHGAINEIDAACSGCPGFDCGRCMDVRRAFAIACDPSANRTLCLLTFGCYSCRPRISRRLAT
jgi:hypothetical protein